MIKTGTDAVPLPRKTNRKNLKETKLQIEDEFAELAGDLCLGLVATRRRRLSYMTNQWPNRAVLILSGDEKANDIAQELEFDHKVFEHMQSVVDPGPILKGALRRSVFQTVPVQQLVAAFTEFEWKSSPDIVDLQERRWSGCLSSVIIEEFNNIQKNNGSQKTKFRRPERSMAAALSSSVIDGRNKYVPVAATVPLPKSTPGLQEQNAFGKSKRD